MARARPLPSFRATARALRTTTERFTLELRDPQPDSPSWSGFEWDVARAVISMHGIGTLLCHRVRWRGTPRFQDFIAAQREHSVRREAKIGVTLARIDEQARRAGVGLIALKGSALRNLDLYAPGERPMGDIDLLARPEDLPAAADVLAAADYGRSFESRRHEVFVEKTAKRSPTTLGEHVDNPIKIEVHSRIAEPLPSAFVDITPRLFESPLCPGLNAYPSRGALIAHLLLHAAGNMRAIALRLVQLIDIALLMPRMHASDWSELLAIHGGRAPWWALPPLLITEHCLGVSAPREVIAALRSECPPLLARAARRYTLSDVSWSNLRISAFPGIEWSRSIGEALHFVKSRIAPEQVALDELDIAIRVQPQIATIPWYGLSQGSRALRWLFSRPPRVQTMTSVRAALADEPAG